jgi:hypothetical protein
MRIENINGFKQWLQDRGCDILPPTNEYEAIRFKGKSVGIIYKTGKTSNQYTQNAIYCFKNNKKWDGQPIKTGRKSTYKKEKEKLILRDGTSCFYCGKEMNDDITLEHLIALSSGGKNELSNMVLCHESCNQAVKNKPIGYKVNIAIKNRVELIIKNKIITP